MIKIYVLDIPKYSFTILYSYPCYISLKNKDMFPGKKES
jgi:hypothetical protein